MQPAFRIVVIAFITGTFCLGSPLPSRAQQPAVKDSTKKNIIYRFFNQSERRKVLVYPVAHVSYDEQTSWKFGVDGRIAFRIGRDQKNHLSYIEFPGFYYTLNRQLNFRVRARLYLNNNYRALLLFSYKKFPDSFYGVGNNTNNNDKEHYDMQTFHLQAEFLRRLISKIYIGPHYEFERTIDVSHGENGLLAQNNVEGSRGYQVSGLGVTAEYDTRDNGTFPTAGENIEFNVMMFSPVLQSDEVLIKYDFKFRKYIQVAKQKSHIIAMDFNLVMRDNDPPFSRMSTVGEVIRGFNKNRFRDRNRIHGQLEYRFPIFWRFRGAVFFALGDVFENTSDLSLSNLKYAGGAGIRLVLDKKEKLSIRFDYAVGKDWANGYYLGINEAF